MHDDCVRHARHRQNKRQKGGEDHAPADSEQAREVPRAGPEHQKGGNEFKRHCGRF